MKDLWELEKVDDVSYENYLEFEELKRNLDDIKTSKITTITASIGYVLAGAGWVLSTLFPTGLLFQISIALCFFGLIGGTMSLIPKAFTKVDYNAKENYKILKKLKKLGKIENLIEEYHKSPRFLIDYRKYKESEIKEEIKKEENNAKKSHEKIEELKTALNVYSPKPEDNDDNYEEYDDGIDEF